MSTRTARFEISDEFLFELLGLSGLAGKVANVRCDPDRNTITLFVAGNDARLPDNDMFPESELIITQATHYYVTDAKIKRITK